MTANPQVSVIMAVHNGEEFLCESVDSILSQTFSDFELIVVDDASTDATEQILAEYMARDERVRVLRNEVNSERCVSRNRALDAARADLVALMDADDVSLPRRLEVQTAFMRSHPEVIVCGSFYKVYETDQIVALPQSDTAIRVRLLFECPLAQPTVMLRKGPLLSFTGGYDPSRPPGEDYDLWVRLARHSDAAFANIPEVLVRYRVHPDTVRVAYTQLQERQADRSRELCLSLLMDSVSQEELECHLALAYMPVFSPSILMRCVRWPEYLRTANRQAGKFDSDALEAELRYRAKQLPAQILKSLLPGRAHLRAYRWRLQRLFHSVRYGRQTL